MKTESEISERGQVTIPKDLRDRFGLRAGTKVTFVSSPKGLILRKAGQEKFPGREVFGILTDKKRTDDYLDLVRGPVE